MRTRPVRPDIAGGRSFANVIREYGCNSCYSDNYSAEVLRAAFLQNGINVISVLTSTSDTFMALEPRIRAGGIRFVRVPQLQDQLLGLVVRGGKVTTRNGTTRDDFAASAALALYHCHAPARAEDVKPAAPVIVPINPVSPGLVNLHEVSRWGAFDAEW